MKIKSGNLREECDAVVLSKFEDEKKLSKSVVEIDKDLDLIEKYAISQDNFEGKFGATYVLQTYGKIPAKKESAWGSPASKAFPSPDESEPSGIPPYSGTNGSPAHSTAG